MSGWAVVGVALKVLGAVVLWVGARKIAADRTFDFAKVAMHSPQERALSYGRVVLACAVLAFLSWATYGSHHESDDGDDGGYRVEDFQPSAAERTRHAMPLFLTILPIALHGTWYGRRHRRAGGIA